LQAAREYSRAKIKTREGSSGQQAHMKAELPEGQISYKATYKENNLSLIFLHCARDLGRCG
jgi:hypothetical protein